jgi:hypothetical protein
MVSVVVGVTWFGQLNVQRAQERISAQAAEARRLRAEVQALRQMAGAAEQRAAEMAAMAEMAEMAEMATGCGVAEAFLTFLELDRGAPGAYIELARVLVASIRTFSTRPVIVYGVTAHGEDTATARQLRNMTAEFARPGLVQLRFIQPAPGSLFFSKLKAVIASNIGCGIYVDADAVVNYRVDELFATCQARRAPHPLLVAHNNDPNNQQGSGRWQGGGGTQPKSAPYAWAASFMWSSEAVPFMLDAYERCVVGSEFNRANYDETALNVLMWERGIREQACVYATYPRAGELEAWYANQSWPLHARYSVHDVVAFHVSSGGKNPEKSWALLRLYMRLAARRNKVYYNQRTATWLDSADVGLCLVNPPPAEAQAKALMLHRWSPFSWEDRHTCCSNDPAFEAANLP